MFERYLRVHSIFHGCQFWMNEHLIVGPVFQSLFIFGRHLFSCCFGLFWKGSVFLSSFRSFWRNKESCHRRNTQLQPLEQDSSCVFDWIFCPERVFVNIFWGIYFPLFFFCCWSLKYPPSHRESRNYGSCIGLICLSVSIIWGGRAWKSHSPLRSLLGQLFCLAD